MNLVIENAESHLNNFIAGLESRAQTWRIISIEFQDCETLHSPLFQNLCEKNLHTFFDQSDCRIFWLKPSFILIFFQGRALPIEKCVEGFLKETEFKGFGRFFDIMDLSIHWNNLISLVGRITTKKPAAKTPATAEKIIKETNDEIEFSQGDTFTITLSKEHIRQMAFLRLGREKPLLLLVEDDPFTLQLVRLALKDSFEIIAAETARQALAYYQRHLPDMVFQDIQLPDGNGINILEQVNIADPNAYVVMLSSHSQKEIIIDCQMKGAKGFIGKPFTRQRLNDAAVKFLDFKKKSLMGQYHGT